MSDYVHSLQPGFDAHRMFAAWPPIVQAVHSRCFLLEKGVIEARLSSGALAPLRAQHGSQKIPASAPIIVQKRHSAQPALICLAILARCLHVQPERALQ